MGPRAGRRPYYDPAGLGRNRQEEFGEEQLGHLDRACPTAGITESARERGSTMFNSGSGSLVRTGRMLVLVLVAAILSGCNSKQEQALDQAKKQAAATGQAQQVVSVDTNGTTTTLVQPPAAGQTIQAITTTVTPPAAGAPVPAHSGPTVSAVPQPAPAPVSVSIPAGTTLTIRMDQHISVKTSHAGDTFTGEMMLPVLDGDNIVLVPKGATVD